MKHSYLLFLVLCPLVLAASDYEILEKVDTVVVQSSNFSTGHHKEVIRILTEDGTSYQKALYVNSYVHIKNIKGTIYFPDGRTDAIDEEQIMELPISQSAVMISDLKAVMITPASLVVGAKVAIEYDREITSLIYLDSFVYRTFVPLRKATCKLSFPSTISMKYRGADENVKLQKVNEGGNTTLIFESANQKEIGLIGEESSGNVERRVEFLPEKCTTDKWILVTSSWQEIGKWFSELSKFAYQTEGSMDGVVSDISAKHKEPEKIADALYQYVQQNYNYTAVEVGIGGFKPRFASQTYFKKYGDCKDLTFLYLALLRKAGIEGYPALVDTRSSRFFFKDFPNPRQFNHCIAYLPAIRNGTWVDTTVKNFRLGEIPSTIQGKFALVTGGPNGLMKIPENFMESNLFRIVTQAKLSERELQVNGEMQTSGMGSMILDVMQNALLRNQVKHYVMNKMLLKGLPIQKLQTDIRSERSLHFNYSAPVSQVGNFDIALINPLHYEPVENLSLAPEPDQYFAVGDPVRIILQTEMDLGNRRLVSAPYQKEAKGKYVSYKLELLEKDGRLSYTADTYFANGFLTDAEMTEYQKELREFSGLLQRSVVLK